MNKIQFLKLFCKNIKSGKFNDKKYRAQRSYYGHTIQTQPTFSSYGTIGYSVTIFWNGNTHDQVRLYYDWELNELDIECNTFGRWNYMDYINLLILDENSITKESNEPVWEDHPRSVELETYTDGGEDMIISLEEPTRESLQEYINNFDINETVMLWWREGEDTARANGVPFDNIADHYGDYSDYLETLQAVCNQLY